jgi:DNA-damage-inducible protein J
MSKPTPALITKTQLQPDVRAAGGWQKRAKTIAVLKAIAVLKRAGVSVPASLVSLAPNAPKRGVSPYRRLIPNAKTVAAIEAARRGELTTFGSIDDMFADLNADD